MTPSSQVEQEYISVGANRYSAASSYDREDRVLAYGADSNVALWRPLNDTSHGVYELLKAHTDKVTAVQHYHDSQGAKGLLSGSADGVIALWRSGQADSGTNLISVSKVHDGAVNTIATLDHASYFVTGGADGVIKVSKFAEAGFEAICELRPRPRFIPLALALGTSISTDAESAKGFFLAAAGTRTEVFIYSLSADGRLLDLACSLTGHEGWIRSLALKRTETGYLLASTSADQYTRLWRIDNGSVEKKSNAEINAQIPSTQQTLTAKVKSVSVGQEKFSITFEALLLCHEDWAYAADWQDGAGSKLLTASADGTLAIWEPDESSGIWVSETRLGEISGQKGATTATGSSGGFWTAKWINEHCVVSLGRTGSWRMWKYDETDVFWHLLPGVGGHTDSANGLCWSPQGEYLLTTSSDQTTRLHATWKRNGIETWHEFSRCQIHGYNCNVVECITPHQFVSGAEEKLLRVFNEPKELAETLHKLCDIALPQNVLLPESAAIPVLGLSNKEVGEPDDIIEAGPRKGDDDYAAAKALAGITVRGISTPPTEDLLSRHTLWPEYEKLYGHGYEISEAAYGHGLLATSCKASSLEHAVIRLYNPENDWRQLDTPLSAHSLTVTRLSWSVGSTPYLLSVGRDRQWTIFKLNKESNVLDLVQVEAKAHTRMILDAAFSPSSTHPFFATAGRDKLVKIWGHDTSHHIEGESDKLTLIATIQKAAPVTAIAITTTRSQEFAVIAVGQEDGNISLHFFKLGSEQFAASLGSEVPSELCPSKAINRMAWSQSRLAMVCADGSVRILRFDLEAMCSSAETAVNETNVSS